jgi:hopanoid biosynthesis associated RND transporter like protein HpnN
MSAHTDRVGRLLAAWAAWLCRAPRTVLALTLLATALLLPWTAARLSVHTDTADIIADELPARQDYIELRNAFPQLVRGLIVVIDGETPELAEDARARLARALAAQPELFPWVYAPGGDPFFARNGLLFLDLPALDRLAERLARAQPLLGPLARDTTLRGLAGALDLLARAPPDADVGAEADALLAATQAALLAAADGRFHRVSWGSLLGPQGEEPQRLLLLRPELDTEALAPARAPLEAVRAAARELHIDAQHGLRMRLTGPVALEHEELLSVARGAGLAAVLALVMVSVVLTFGLGSGRLVAAAVVTLGVGLVATAAFAALAVGELNLISIAFVVLYIGLGIDYSVHLCLRYRELREDGTPQDAALRGAVSGVGSSLVLCAITNSVGFFAFYPTTFKGVSELGLISGTGMWIALVLSVSLLPVLLTLWPFEPRGASLRAPRRALLPRFPPGAVTVVAFLLAAGAALLLPRVRFDSNPLNLRAPDSESVTTYRELLASPDRSPLALAWLAPDPESARRAADEARALPVVARVVMLDDLVPADQDEKLDVIEELRWIVGPTRTAPPAEPGPADRQPGFAALSASLSRLDGARFAHAKDAAKAAQALEARLAALPPDTRAERLAELDESLLSGLRFQLERLALALSATPVTVADLPAGLTALWRSADGRYRLEIAPKENLAVPGATERFVEEVRAVLPHATGLAVIQQDAGRSVANAFRQALITALVAISVLAFVLMRGWRDTLLVLTPVFLGTLLTVGAAVLLDMPFNFANVIALPLLLGICVDNGIHIVHRHRESPAAGGVLATSTARAVVVSALTTIVTFGNLAFSGHPGMASMGRLLALGLVIGLACSLLTLPALLEWGPKRSSAEAHT